MRTAGRKATAPGLVPAPAVVTASRSPRNQGPSGDHREAAGSLRERVRVLGANGGYILAPSHAIQAGTPPENVIAFLEASQEKI